MDEIDLNKLNKKLDEALELLWQQQRVISAMGELLVSAVYVTKAKGLNENTITRNDRLEKYNEFGKRKLLMTLESVAVIKNRKPRKKSR